MYMRPIRPRIAYLIYNARLLSTYSALLYLYIKYIKKNFKKKYLKINIIYKIIYILSFFFKKKIKNNNKN
jgi:hypothetical protein